MSQNELQGALGENAQLIARYLTLGLTRDQIQIVIENFLARLARLQKGK